MPAINPQLTEVFVALLLIKQNKTQLQSSYSEQTASTQSTVYWIRLRKTH